MLDELRRELEKTSRIETQRLLSPARRVTGALINLRGKEVVDFTNWDLLGIGSHPKVKRAAQAAIERGECGAGGARTAGGTSAECAAAEERLARFLGTERTLILSSKNQAIFTIFGALLNERDAVIADELVQSPVNDAAFLVNSTFQSYRAGSADAAAIALEKNRAARRKIFFCETTSAVLGNPNELGVLAALCAKYDAQMIADESFSLGITGLRGAGGVEKSAVLPPFCIIGDFGYSFGLFGGFIAGPQILIEYLVQRSRAIGLDIPLPAPNVCAIETALDSIEISHGEREKLALKASVLAQELQRFHISTVTTLPAPIVSVAMPKLSKARELVDAMFQRGFHLDLVSPAVSFSEVCYVRLLVTSRHTERQLKAVAQALGEIMPRLFKK